MLDIEVSAFICWTGVVVIPWPNPAVATSISYLNDILPETSLGSSIPVLEPNPSFLKYAKRSSLVIYFCTKLAIPILDDCK